MQHPSPENLYRNSEPYFAHSYAAYATNPNDNPNSDRPVQPVVDANSALVQPYPPGVDPPYVPTTVTQTVTYAQPPHSFAPQQPRVGADTAVGYHPDPNAVAVKNWVAAIWQLGASLGTSVLGQAAGSLQGISVPSGDVLGSVPAIGNTSAAFLTNPQVQSQGNSSREKISKKTKVVQSVWCEVCKIECNTKDVLEQHKSGKKHRKNVEKLSGATSTVAVSAPFIGPQEKPDQVNATSGEKRAARPKENLETKRRKVLAGGATAEAVRTCVYCNVVCNSDIVFTHHLAGKQHAANVKKHAVAGAT